MTKQNAFRPCRTVLLFGMLVLILAGCKAAPIVVSTTPADGATQVPAGTVIRATFSRDINPDSVNASTFTLSQGTTAVSGQVSYDSATKTAAFTPSAPLALGKLCTATLAKGVGAEIEEAKCLDCNFPYLAVSIPVVAGILAIVAAPAPGLAEDFAWTFSTGAGGAPPSAKAGSDQNVNLAPGAVSVDVTLDGSASSSSEKSITAYAWTGVPDPEDVAKPTVSVGPGTHVFTLTVTDSSGLVSDPDSVTVFVNQPPVADVTASTDLDVVLAPGQTTLPVVLDSSLSEDPDGTIVAWNWSGDPDPENIANPTVVLGAGVHEFTLVVTDDRGAVSPPDTITITVHLGAANTPPVAQIVGSPNPTHADTSLAPEIIPDESVLYGLQQYAGGGISLDHINPADGSVTKSVPVVLANSTTGVTNGYGLAADPTTGTLWAVLLLQSDKSDKLITSSHALLTTLDPETGVAHLVAEITGEAWPEDLACAEDGTLYAVGNSEGTSLYTVDRTNGGMSPLWSLDSSSGGYDAIVYDPARHRLARAFETPGETVQVQYINLATGETTPVDVAAPAENYTFYQPTALTVFGGAATLYLAENVSRSNRLSTLTVSGNIAAEVELPAENSTYGGLAFGYKKRFPVTAVNLSGATSYDPDPADSIVSYAWTVISVPEHSAVTEVDNPAAVSTTLTPDVPGDYTVQLVVSDGKDNSTPVTYVVIYENAPPVANAGPDQMVSNSDPSLEVCVDGTTSFDPDGDPLTYSWSVTDPYGSPAYPYFYPDGTTAQVCFNFGSTPTPGNYTVTLTVTEARTGGASATDSLTLTVTDGSAK